jgi:hypothetical protein
MAPLDSESAHLPKMGAMDKSATIYQGEDGNCIVLSDYSWHTDGEEI